VKVRYESFIKSAAVRFSL